MDPRQAGPVAVLAADVRERERLRTILAAIGLESCGYGSAAELASALRRQPRFAMLVLSFDRSAIEAKSELALVCDLALPGVPLMLLMDVVQVELAAYVMHSPCNDFLLSPYTEEELRRRFEHLYMNYVGRNVDRDRDGGRGLQAVPDRITRPPPPVAGGTDEGIEAT